MEIDKTMYFKEGQRRPSPKEMEKSRTSQQPECFYMLKFLLFKPGEG
jgi:hypothetical protein